MTPGVWAMEYSICERYDIIAILCNLCTKLALTSFPRTGKKHIIHYITTQTINHQHTLLRIARKDTKFVPIPIAQPKFWTEPPSLPDTISELPPVR